MNDTVADGVSEYGVTDLFPLAVNVKLRAKYCRGFWVSRLRDLVKISRFGFLERMQQPLVQYEQRRFLVLLYGLGIIAIFDSTFTRFIVTNS